MADDSKDKNESAKDAEQVPPPADSNSKMRLIVIMALCMVLLSVTAMVTTVLLTMNRDTSTVSVADSKATSDNTTDSEADVDASEVEEEEDSDSVDNGTPFFYQFNPTFVVNIPSKGREKFLQVQVQVMSYDEKTIEIVEQYAPLIKNDLVQLFSQQEYADLIKPGSKEMLRSESLKLIKTLLTKHTGEDGIEQVLFTSFITQ